MNLIDNLKQKQTLRKPRRLVTISFLSLTLFCFAENAVANQATLNLAETAIANNDYERAQVLLEPMTTSSAFKTEALYGLARVSFFKEQLDTAEDFIAEALQITPDNPEYLFIAARIAGKQAQSASMFSKLGYARDAHNYFTQALKINKNHQPSLIGLIRFHQQAPVMAGGDKDTIPDLIDRLRLIDKRAAFSIEAPKLFSDKKVDQVFRLYREALQSDSSSDSGQFMFDFAMLLSNQGLYQPALKELLSIDLSKEGYLPGFTAMRLYQIGKLAAESQSQLTLGLENMTQYSEIRSDTKTISKNWVDFRLAQLKFLIDDRTENSQPLTDMMRTTSDRDLKKKIKSVLKKHKDNRGS
jgi:tetratricopeptide (TPR) repeat protein